MNSVLEPDRKLLLVEKIGRNENLTAEEITAKKSFMFVATMNPGGDFGKKELSPALRNRFFEIWCPNENPVPDLRQLIRQSLKFDDKLQIEVFMTDFLEFLEEKYPHVKLSIRDLMSWVHYLNTNYKIHRFIECCLVHGLCLILLDGANLLSNLTTSSERNIRDFKNNCRDYLTNRLRNQNHDNPNCDCYKWINNSGTCD